MPHSYPHRPGEISLGSAANADEVKDYYRQVEAYDWVDVADNLRGPEALFHRNRAHAVRQLVHRYANGSGPILDAGAGTGLNLRHLPEGSVGLDINPRNIAILTARLPRHTIVEGDIEAMPFSPASFGTVVCTEVLEHVPDSRAALAEIHRVLAPGGRLIGSVPARALIWKLRFLSSTCPHTEPFHNEYLRPEVRQMLEAAGFRVELLKYSLLHFSVLFVASKSA